MNDIKDLTKCIARLWRLHKRQESLFLTAMSLNISFELRKVFSRGYMMSLLFRKDIDAMYQLIKNNLHDGDLSSIIRSVDDYEPNSISEREILTELLSQQQILLETYESLVSKLDFGSQAAHYCDEHMEKLAHLKRVLERELINYPSEESSNYYSVA